MTKYTTCSNCGNSVKIEEKRGRHCLFCNPDTSEYDEMMAEIERKYPDRLY